MLIVLSNFLLFSLRWFCDSWRQARYTEIMNRLLNRTSVLIQRCQTARYTRLEAGGILRNSLPMHETELLTSSSQLLMKDDFLTMHEIKSWATVDLSSWVTYPYSRYQPETHQVSLDLRPGTHLVLLEGGLCDRSKSANISQPHPVHDLSYHILTFGTPVAWTTREPYGVVMNCDSKDSLIRMVDAFGQQRLVVSDGLEVTSIGTVKTTGYPQALSRSRKIFSPAADKEHVSYTSMGKESTDKSQPKTISPDLTSLSSHKTFATPKSKMNGKPPNLLIYCGAKDTKRKFDEALESIKGCVNTDSYTVYHLKHEDFFTSPWQENAAAVIISSCQRLQPDVKQKISEYVFNYSGNLISFGSSADSLFANHLDIVKNEVSNNFTTFNFGDWSSVSACCGPFVYSNCRDYARVIVPVIKKEPSDEDAAHVVMLNLERGGCVILSQLFLEQDPVSQAKDKESFNLLKKSNTARLGVLQELLALIGLNTRHATPPALTPCYLLSKKKNAKENFLSSLQPRLKDGVLKSKSMNLVFLSSNQSQVDAQATSLPVLTYGTTDSIKFDHFDMTDYWHHLETSSLGQIVMYTDVITSTMTVFDGLLFCIPEGASPIAIAGRQVQGKGRAGNAWLSPVGCAMFTMPLKINLNSTLGQRISFVQHLVALSVVQGVTSLPGYQDLDLRLKWPNDIYYGKEMKLGGVLVLSSVMSNTIYITIGCGVNVSNSDPTICINDIIHQYNTSNRNQPPLSTLTTGQVIAQTMNCFEKLISDFESKGPDYVSEIYYKYWLHGGCKVKIDLELKTEGEIVGLDEFGFLSVRTTDGALISVQPDGNSFDMMHNLICVKTS